MMSTTYINVRPVRMVDHWYRLNDVLVALDFCKAYASWIARYIDDEHKTRIGPKTQEAWHVSFEGLVQWSKTSPHWFDAKRRQKLIEHLERRCVFCGQKMLGEVTCFSIKTGEVIWYHHSNSKAGRACFVRLIELNGLQGAKDKLKYLEAHNRLAPDDVLVS